MKKYLFLCFILSAFILTVSETGWSAKISGSAPQILETGNPVNDVFVGEINTKLSEEFDTQIGDANVDLAKYNKQTKLAGAFAAANTFVSHSATQVGYQGYDLFSVSIGGMLGAQLPTLDPWAIESESKKITADGDVEMGVGMQPWAVQIGINTKLIPGLPDFFKDTRIALKYGSMSIDYQDFSFDSMTFGVLGNYQLVDSVSLLGLLVWRGVSVGSGFIYQSNVAEYYVKLAEFSTPVSTGLDEITADLVLDPSVNLSIESGSVTIPLEISTAVRLLYVLNITAGAGIDVNFGSTDIIVKSKGNIAIENLTNGYDAKDGDITVDGSTLGETAPYLAPKLMAGLGMCLGPVFIDVPVSWYLTTGFTIGASAGVVW